LHTVRHMRLPRSVIQATAGVGIQHAAGQFGVVQLASVLVFEFHQAAATTAVAQRFPFGTVELMEWKMFPEALTHHGPDVPWPDTGPAPAVAASAGTSPAPGVRRALCPRQR